MAVRTVHDLPSNALPKGKGSRNIVADCAGRLCSYDVDFKVEVQNLLGGVRIG